MAESQENAILALLKQALAEKNQEAVSIADKYLTSTNSMLGKKCSSERD